MVGKMDLIVYQIEYPWSNNAPDASKLIRTFEAFKDDNLFVFLHLTRLHAPFLSSDNLQTPQTNKIEDLGCAHDGNFLPSFFPAKVFDDQIGIIIDYLRRTNQYDDTMIILTGDHGTFLQIGICGQDIMRIMKSIQEFHNYKVTKS